jgi:diketogulonate reductase-like aldo/keto reductase
VRSSEAIIAIAGSYGTLSEIALALKMEVPVIGLGTWQLRAPDGSIPPIIPAQTAADAVEKAFSVLQS